MTTKLIQELVGLCVEKGVKFEYRPTISMLFVEYTGTGFYPDGIKVSKGDAPQQLQAAIEKVKQL